MADKGYLLAIRDNFERLLSKSVFSIVEAHMNTSESDFVIKNKIFSVVVECVQNICSTTNNHSTEKNSILLLNKLPNGHNVIVGTLLQNERKLRLSSFLDILSKLSVNELKKTKKELISQRTDLNEVQKESLALVDMFIRSEGKIKYRYENYKGNDLFLIIEIEISNN